VWGQVNDLVRALRHVDLSELADIVDQCYQQGVELSNLPTKFPKTQDEEEADEAEPPAAAEETTPTE